MLPRVRCVPCLATVACLPLKSHFYATTLSFIPFVLLRLACEVGQETMAALDGQPFPSMVHVVIACWGVVVGRGAHRPAYVLCVWNHMHLSKHGKRKVSVRAALVQTKTNEDDETMADASSCHWHPGKMLLYVSHSLLICTLSHQR